MRFLSVRVMVTVAKRPSPTVTIGTIITSRRLRLSLVLLRRRGFPEEHPVPTSFPARAGNLLDVDTELEEGGAEALHDVRELALCLRPVLRAFQGFVHLHDVQLLKELLHVSLPRIL